MKMIGRTVKMKIPVIGSASRVLSKCLSRRDPSTALFVGRVFPAFRSCSSRQFSWIFAHQRRIKAAMMMMVRIPKRRIRKLLSP